MPITVELQEMHQYSIIPIAILLVLVLALTIILPILWLKGMKRKEKKPKPVKPAPKPIPLTPEQIRNKYGAKLDELEKRCRNGLITNRAAYQELSIMMRYCAYELTGKPVHKYTLDELMRGNIPGLVELIDDCYAPEFSQDKKGDIYETIEKARMVMGQWK